MLKNRITPKWVIFLIDLVVCAVCYVYANYLLSDFKVVTFYQHELVYGVLLVSCTNCIFFFAFKSYDGIIRLSEFQESLRSVSAVFCTFFLLFLLNIFLKVVQFNSYIATSSLIVYFFTSSFIITGYRILVRKLYAASVEYSEIVNVVIYGCQNNGSVFKKSLDGDITHRYRVVAFVDDDERFIGKSIDNTPIYSYRNLTHVISLFQVQILFFARPDMNISIKNRVVDDCLEKRVKVMNIPPFKQWLHGHVEFNQLQEVKIEELLGRPAIELNNDTALGSVLKGRKILITGAAGSIGSELARQLALLQPALLILCDQAETALHNLEYELEKNVHASGFIKSYLCDIKDYHSAELMFTQCMPEIVFHAAAYKHVPVMENHPSEAVRNNVLGTKVIADLSIKYSVDRFLFISTDKAINPTNIMGASKRIAEMYCHILQEQEMVNNGNVIALDPRNLKTKFITTRFGNVLASNGSVIPRFHEQIRNGGPVTVTHPDIIRYFMTIQEACSLVLEAAVMGRGGEIFIFDMGEPVRIYDLAAKMIKLTGREPGNDIKIQITGLRPGEKLYEELLNKQEEVIPTHHSKILIAKNAQFDHTIISGRIDYLLRCADTYADAEVVVQMTKIVPEFISNNPVYSLYENTEKEQTVQKLHLLN